MARHPRILSPQTLTVLDALADAGDARRYGLELCTVTGLRSGSLYPILARLLERGLVEGEWLAPSRPGRPPRHGYRITGAGRSALVEARGARTIDAQAFAL